MPLVHGVYALVIEVTGSFAVPGFQTLQRCRYIYANSAHGLGGIRARAHRHLKLYKTVHWHVDRLTNAFGVALVIALQGGGASAA